MTAPPETTIWYFKTADNCWLHIRKRPRTKYYEVLRGLSKRQKSVPRRFNSLIMACAYVGKEATFEFATHYLPRPVDARWLQGVNKDRCAALPAA